MTMEEYLRNEIQNELGNEKGVVEVTIREMEKERSKYYHWIIDVKIQHKDICFTYSKYVDDVLFGNNHFSRREVVSEYEIFVKKELLKRFYEKEES